MNLFIEWYSALGSPLRCCEAKNYMSLTHVINNYREGLDLFGCSLCDEFTTTVYTELVAHFLRVHNNKSFIGISAGSVYVIGAYAHMCMEYVTKMFQQILMVNPVDRGLFVHNLADSILNFPNKYRPKNVLFPCSDIINGEDSTDYCRCVILYSDYCCALCDMEYESGLPSIEMVLRHISLHESQLKIQSIV